MEDKKLPEIRKACDLDIKFPENKNLTSREKRKIENAIIKGGTVKEDGRTFLDKEELPKVLVTDKKGAAIVYNDSQEDDKLEDGNKSYLATSQVKKVIDERLQEPRGALEQAKLKHSEQCLTSFRDSPELVNERLIEADRIAKIRPQLTKKVMREEKIEVCELSGEKFENDAEAHHKVRVADDPRKARDNKNLAVIKKPLHGEIHDEGYEGEDGFEEYAKDKGYEIAERLRKK